MAHNRFYCREPPFIGARRIKTALPAEYVDALRAAYPKVPRTADFVMYWWVKAAEAVSTKLTRRFGLITTNSVTQDYSRGVMEDYINGKNPKMSLAFATTNHPWVDTQDGAAVRIAMTVGTHRKPRRPTIMSISGDGEESRHEVERINSRLANVPDFSKVEKLQANKGMCFQGVVPAGDGFKMSDDERQTMNAKLNDAERSRIRKYYIGRDIIERPRNNYIIDLFGLGEEVLKSYYPFLHAYLWDRVKPKRDENAREQYRRLWWVFAEPRPAMRNSFGGISRFIGTTYTAKHRVFQFCDSDILPDAMVYSIPSMLGEHLAVLSSKVHLTWCRGCTGTLEDRPRYNSANTFAPFAFPNLQEPQILRSLGEQLDAHRKRQQAAHPKLTLTQMYNVLEKLRAGEPIKGKDKDVYDQGLIGILKDVHDQIDAAVADAYGWPANLSDEDILTRLVDLNHERAEEEARGIVRWLRPEYQNPEGKAASAREEQASLDVGIAESAEKAPWPKTLPDQIAAVREALEACGEATPEQIARRFKRARTTSVQPLLESLAALGQATTLEDGRYSV